MRLISPCSFLVGAGSLNAQLWQRNGGGSTVDSPRRAYPKLERQPIRNVSHSSLSARIVAFIANNPRRDALPSQISDELRNQSGGRHQHAGCLRLFPVVGGLSFFFFPFHLQLVQDLSRKSEGKGRFSRLHFPSSSRIAVSGLA